MKLIKNCLKCNKEFKTWSCRVKIGFGKYCSYKCKSLSQKGKATWNKNKRGIWSIEQRNHLANLTRLGIIGNKGKKFSAEHKRKMGLAISIALKGRKLSEATKQKMRGRIPWNKGKKMPQISGEKNVHWKGGITALNFQIRHSLEYKIYREKGFQRDNYTCQECGERGKINFDHYPISFSTFLHRLKIKNLQEALLSKELWDISNGRTLCVPCHRKTDTYGKNLTKVRKL